MYVIVIRYLPKLMALTVPFSSNICLHTHADTKTDLVTYEHPGL